MEMLLYTVTDIPFLIKMQNGENQLNRSSLMITGKNRLAKIILYGDMLKNL